MNYTKQLAYGVHPYERRETMAANDLEEIKLHVTSEAARVFRTLTREEQLRLETMVSLQLLGMLQPRRPLGDVIADMSRAAQERGLTPELLEEILS
jgi:hypothetical protein